MRKKIETIIASHQFLCSAATKGQAPCLEGEKRIPVVINVYDSGKTDVLCPLIEDYNVRLGRCNSSHREFSRDREFDFGVCIYHRKLI